jgi:DNA-binding HxlR family transcriptional regulator
MNRSSFDAVLRGRLMAGDCPSRDVLRHLTSRWGFLVMLALEDGTKRFSQVRNTIGGISERMLAETLQVLEGDGFVDRKALPVVPPHVEYTLTPLGLEAVALMRQFGDWLERALPRIMAARTVEIGGAVV